MKYRAEIDGLRALAVLPVILFHAGFSHFGGGYVGVDVFFVISGFLITTIIARELSDGRFSLLHFYERRARRILPALYVTVLGATMGAVFILLPSYLADFGKSLISIPIFLSNVYFWSERGYFDGATELKPMVHTWSLAVEEQFYVLYPLLLMGLFARKKTLFCVLAAGFFVSMAASWYLTRLHFETAFYLPISRAWELLCGAAVAWLLMKNHAPKTAMMGEVLALLGLGLILYAVFGFDKDTAFPSLNSAYPVIGTALVLYGTTTARFTRQVLSFKPFVVIGLCSYSLYLFHQPVFALARHAEVFAGYEYLWIALSTAAAFGSYKFVEAPFRDKSTFNARQILRYAVLSSLAVMAVGAVLVKSDGVINRYSDVDQKVLAQFVEIDGYNQARFDAMVLKDFENDGRRKVLLVGDSFAKDLLNVVYEGGYARNFDISTKQVNAECGSIYLTSYDEIAPFIPASRAERCKVIGRFEDERTRALAAAADEIWLTSSWKEWVVPFVPQTIERLEAEFGVRVRVFGLKNFGKVSQKRMLSIPVATRPAYTQPVRKPKKVLHELMRSTLSGYHQYYDILQPLCGGDVDHCQVFTAEGAIMSPDGGHLTQAGATEAAVRLREVFSEIVGDAKP